jgi:hypothetical protein
VLISSPSPASKSCAKHMVGLHKVERGWLPLCEQPFGL